jgi:hypothetical protein
LTLWWAPPIFLSRMERNLWRDLQVKRRENLSKPPAPLAFSSLTSPFLKTTQWNSSLLPVLLVVTPLMYNFYHKICITSFRNLPGTQPAETLTLHLGLCNCLMGDFLRSEHFLRVKTLPSDKLTPPLSEHEELWSLTIHEQNTDHNTYPSKHLSPHFKSSSFFTP